MIFYFLLFIIMGFRPLLKEAPFSFAEVDRLSGFELVTLELLCAVHCVQALKGAPVGPVRIGICRPLNPDTIFSQESQVRVHHTLIIYSIDRPTKHSPLLTKLTNLPPLSGKWSTVILLIIENLNSKIIFFCF